MRKEQAERPGTPRGWPGLQPSCSALNPGPETGQNTGCEKQRARVSMVLVHSSVFEYSAAKFQLMATFAPLTGRWNVVRRNLKPDLRTGNLGPTNQCFLDSEPALAVPLPVKQNNNSIQTRSSVRSTLKGTFLRNVHGGFKRLRPGSHLTV